MRALLGLGLLLVLAACDSERPEAQRRPAPAPPVQQEQPAQAPPREAVVPSVPAAAPAEVVPTPPVVIPAPTQRPPSPAAPSAKPAVVPKPSVADEPATAVAVPRPPARPLDLSLPGEDVERFPAPADAASVLGEGTERADALLPPLFNAQEEARPPFELGGRLITNEGAEDGYLDTVEGAELQLRFRR